jgi:predicted nucleic acid-binding protein
VTRTTVVDASVAFGLHLNGPRAKVAAEAMAQADVTLAPDLIVSEVANAAWVTARAGMITNDEGAAIVALLASHFTRIIPSSSVAPRGYEIATELGHPVYDCLYLALAELESAVLVTFDRRLANVVETTQWKGVVNCLS